MCWWGPVRSHSAVLPACRPNLSSESASSNSVGWMLGSTPPSQCQHAGEEEVLRPGGSNASCIIWHHSL